MTYLNHPAYCRVEWSLLLVWTTSWQNITNCLFLPVHFDRFYVKYYFIVSFLLWSSLFVSALYFFRCSFFLSLSVSLTESQTTNRSILNYTFLCVFCFCRELLVLTCHPMLFMGRREAKALWAQSLWVYLASKILISLVWSKIITLIFCSLHFRYYYNEIEHKYTCRLWTLLAFEPAQVAMTESEKSDTLMQNTAVSKNTLELFIFTCETLSLPNTIVHPLPSLQLFWPCLL